MVGVDRPTSVQHSIQYTICCISSSSIKSRKTVQQTRQNVFVEAWEMNSLLKPTVQNFSSKWKLDKYCMGIRGPQGMDPNDYLIQSSQEEQFVTGSGKSGDIITEQQNLLFSKLYVV